MVGSLGHEGCSMVAPGDADKHRSSALAADLGKHTEGAPHMEMPGLWWIVKLLCNGQYQIIASLSATTNP